MQQKVEKATKLNDQICCLVEEEVMGIELKDQMAYVIQLEIDGYIKIEKGIKPKPKKLMKGIENNKGGRTEEQSTPSD